MTQTGLLIALATAEKGADVYQLAPKRILSSTRGVSGMVYTVQCRKMQSRVEGQAVA